MAPIWSTHIDRVLPQTNHDVSHVAIADGVRLPHVSNGLNDYKSFHNAMLLSALNPPPAFFGFCSDMMGLDGDDIRTAIYRAAVYQAVMRISIRKLEDMNPRKVRWWTRRRRSGSAP